VSLKTECYCLGAVYLQTTFSLIRAYTARLKKTYTRNNGKFFSVRYDINITTNKATKDKGQRTMKIDLKPGTEIYKAADLRRRTAIDVITEYPFPGAEVYVCSDDAYGAARCIVVAKRFEDAYQAFVDSLPTIPKDELHNAYGFDTPEEFQEALNEAEYLDLIDGYAFQSGFSGGIVDTTNISLAPWTPLSGIKLHRRRI
jgi:hypothetical protein